MTKYPNFQILFNSLGRALLRAPIVEQENWQSVKAPDHTMELMDKSFQLDIPETIVEMEEQMRLTLSKQWVEPHFKERIGGVPLNPGETYKIWPWYNQNKANDKFRTEKQKFSHTYMERFWPKQAVYNNDSRYDDDMEFKLSQPPTQGIRYSYGDLRDVINLIKKDPTTRQAFLPIWFPEDTGNVMNERVPCTLGYHFIIRNGKMNITYYIRSCDFVRHFTDDVYLAMRLLQHVVDWTFPTEIEYGTLTMHIVSLHMFTKDAESLAYTLKKYENK